MDKTLICLIILIGVYIFLRYMDKLNGTDAMFPSFAEDPVCNRPESGKCNNSYCPCSIDGKMGTCCSGYSCNEAIGQCFGADEAWNCRLKCAGDFSCISQCP